MSLTNSRGLNLPSIPISIPFPTLDQCTPSTSYSNLDASFGPSTPPTTPPCSSDWNALNPAQLGIGRRNLFRRNSSLSSVNSMYEEDDRDEDWTEEEEEKLRRTFETYTAYTSATEAPYAGLLPPSNLTHVVARAVSSGESRVRTRSTTRARRGSSSAEGVSGDDEHIVPKWRHGMKSTRAKILALVKERKETSTEETPRQGDLDATPRRKPMVRQGSMDFLPVGLNLAVAARLGSKLHRAEANPPPSSHPYAHPTRGRLNRTNSLCSLPSIAGSPTQPIPLQHAATISNLSQSISQSISSTRMARTNSDYSGNRDSTGFDSELSQLSQLPLPKNWNEHNQTLLPSSTSASKSLYNLSFDPTPKKIIGLGSAFNTPSLGVYPSPVSNSRRNEMSTRGLGLSSSSSGEFGEELNPLKRSNTFGDGLNKDFQGGPRKTATSGAGKFYLHGGEKDDQNYSSSSSLSSFGSNRSLSSSASNTSLSNSDSTSSYVFPSSSSSTSSSLMKLSTPSPLSSSSAFDLNDLSLGGNLDDERNSSDIELGRGFLDQNYLKAGIEARLLREKFKGWSGWESEQ